LGDVKRVLEHIKVYMKAHTCTEYLLLTVVSSGLLLDY